MRSLTPNYTYVIVTGDTLSHIAEEFGSSVEELMAFNLTIEDRNMIFPGQVLKMPQHCISDWIMRQGIDSPVILANKCLEMSLTIADLQSRVDALNKERDRAYDGFAGQGRRLYELCVKMGAQPGSVKFWLVKRLVNEHQALQSLMQAHKFNVATMTPTQVYSVCAHALGLNEGRKVVSIPEAELTELLKDEYVSVGVRIEVEADAPMKIANAIADQFAKGFFDDTMVRDIAGIVRRHLVVAKS